MISIDIYYYQNFTQGVRLEVVHRCIVLMANSEVRERHYLGTDYLSLTYAFVLIQTHV